MRIGIATQGLAYNYGGILQNWALQQILKDLGHEPITIDAGLKYPFERYLLGYCNTVIHKLFGKKRAFPNKPYNGKSIPKLTGMFVSQHIETTKPLYNFSPKTIDEYRLDALLVGSDQVWRPRYNSSIENMFLDFAVDKHIKRIAYAASFGVAHWEYSKAQTLRCAQLLKKFNAISVREVSGVDLCRKYFGVEASHVLDPTMLVSVERYMQLCNNVSQCKEKYLAVYCLDITQEKMQKINNLANKLNLKIKLFSAHNAIKLSVEQWLAMFRDASFVVTDSFHGTVFSLLFNKSFISLSNADRGNARIESLLKSFELEQQRAFDCSVNWQKVNASLIKKKNESISFLTSALA